jgi:hypothetical protein
MLTSYSRLVARHEDLLNVQYIVKPAETVEPAPIFQDGRWKVYGNPKAYPRAWIVHQAIVETSQEAVFGRLDDPSINLRTVAVIETPLPQALEPANRPDEPVHFRSYEADRIVLDVETGSTGFLILSEIYYPGWRAALNGRFVEIYRVDGGLRGIMLPRGKSRITLEYTPITIYAGTAISLLTFAGVIAGFFVSRRVK